MASQQQVRETITDQIIAALESGGVPPWRRPWRVGPNAGSPANVVSKKPYRGINPILLDMASARHGLTSKWWATFNQWKNLGGKVMPRPSHVPSGRWGTPDRLLDARSPRPRRNDDGEEEEDRFFVMRTLHRLQRRSGRGRPPRPPAGRAWRDRHRRGGRHRLRARRGGHRAATGITHPPRRGQGVLFAGRRFRPGAAEGVVRRAGRVLRDGLPRTRPRHRAPDPPELVPQGEGEHLRPRANSSPRSGPATWPVNWACRPRRT